MAWPIYLYVPNLLGYARIIANVVAFSHCFDQKGMFVTLYFISFVCDELDGRFARLLDQRSTFGAVLDMVTDRVSTASLLVVLSSLYSQYFIIFLGLMVLDISSHWFQMVSAHLTSKKSHKDVADGTNFLLRIYYRYRPFMGYCCIGAEVLYLAVYLLHDPSYAAAPLVDLPMIGERSLVEVIAWVALPGCVIKQFVNLVQIKTAADVCVTYDMKQDVDKKTQ
ncbi:hypothetical protein CBR_g32608 [Chara braunii]|uniref:CDP-diacylglycerol--inositol 3-phosphatidyltransferase n=1 Tax=Chara braunii TaxID=69332 RepID=A0A388LH29_CHABU|nr:hypothetical protein CBR_g32608 [Chara braunii]|eukprot:GBG81616.1 hypothetical protein CBR_g32608 [Chara braunii]